MSLNIELIRESFQVAAGIADQVADKFYEFLFQDYPEVQPLFHDVSLPSQKKALINSLVFIVDKLEEPEKLGEYLRSMGKRHYGYGAVEAHYDAVGSSLLKTFAHFFADQWTEELEEEWTSAFIAIKTLMLEGASYAVPTESVIKKRAKAHAANIILRAMENEIDSDELEEKIRLKIRKIIFEVMESEYQNILDDKKAA